MWVYRLNKIFPIRWPIRLWRVTDIDPPPPTASNTDYWRAVAFTVVEELAPWIALGKNGWRDAWIIERAETLTREDAVALALAIPAGADQDYHQVWLRHLRWLDSGGVVPTDRGGGGGISLAYQAVERAARRVDPQAFEVVEVNEKPVLVGVWRKAASTAMYAVMAFGGSRFLDAEGTERLAAAWRSRFDDPPGDPPELHPTG
jgi:hypothetical protein